MFGNLVQKAVVNGLMVDSLYCVSTIHAFSCPYQSRQDVVAVRINPLWSNQFDLQLRQHVTTYILRACCRLSKELSHSIALFIFQLMPLLTFPLLPMSQIMCLSRYCIRQRKSYITREFFARVKIKDFIPCQL